LNGGAVRKGIAEWHAQFDDVSASFCQRENKVQRGVQRRIARGDERDDAEFARRAEVREASGDTSRSRQRGGHWFCQRLEQAGVSVHVLVAAAGNVENDQVVLGHLRGAVDQPGERVCGFERRDNAFGARK
jgi:hypothetical protein